MTQQLYNKARQALGKGLVNLEGDDVRLVFIDDADYTPDLINDEFLSDVPAASRVAVSTSLASKLVDATGAFSANDLIVNTVSGDPFEGVLLYIHTGVDSTSRLLSYDDTAAQLPITPNGTDITVEFDKTANKIFRV